MIVFGAPSPTRSLLYLSDPCGEAGTTRAANGELIWKRNISLFDKDGANPTFLTLTDNTGIPENTRNYMRLSKTGMNFQGYSGSAGNWRPFAITARGRT